MLETTLRTCYYKLRQPNSLKEAIKYVRVLLNNLMLLVSSRIVEGSLETVPTLKGLTLKALNIFYTVVYKPWRPKVLLNSKSA